MRASLPQVLSVALPESDSDFGAVLDHCWSLDNHRVTDADRLRKANYQSEGKRHELMQASSSFENFLAGLELQVDIAELEESDIPRVSQMTNRTNQFNATTRRMSESEVRAIAGRPGSYAYSCRVKDRFGDYGLVGCVILSTGTDDPELTDFMLSCRVLGRGVEHRIIKFVAEVAQRLPTARGKLHVAFSETPKNLPMRNFLDGIGAIGDAGYLFDTIPCSPSKVRQQRPPMRSRSSPRSSYNRGCWLLSTMQIRRPGSCVRRTDYSMQYMRQFAVATSWKYRL